MSISYDGIPERRGLGNPVAEILLQTEMFPSLDARETYVVEANFASWKQRNVSESSQ